jgi:two-component system sensor histidine kinase YesM
MEKEENRKLGKLQTKLTKIILSLVCLAFLLVFTIVIRTTYSSYREQEISSQRNQLDKTAAQLSSLQTMVKNLSRQVIFDNVVQNGIIAQESSLGDYLYLKRNVQNTLTSYSHILDSIDEIMIYTDDDRTFSSRDIKDPFQPEKNEWYQEFLESEKSSGFTAIHHSETSQDGIYTDVISYMLTYYSVENALQKLGTLVINVDFNTIRNMVYLESDLLEGYCLYDSNGNQLIQSGSLDTTYEEVSEAVGKQENGYLHTKDGDIYLVADGMEDGWLLVSEISETRLMKQAIIANLYLLIPFVFILATVILALRFFIRRIVNPINQLSEAAAEVGKGNFDVSVSVKTNDELEMLSDVFNRMVIDIQEFMHESVEHEKILRRMQIENLMLQINPHFIYNTMNSIVYMARMSGNSQIADFANAFISLLQSTLNVRDSVYQTVREELRTVQNYLYLQKYRYADKFTYEIECEEELMDCQILNVMIQPVVENAIFHGIAPKETTGKLWIIIRREEENLVVCVEDDGVGMTEETIAEQLQSEHVQKGGVRKIGIANVRNRIRETYGEPYDLQIKSKVNEGTRVIMTVPFVRQKQEGE